MSHDQIQTPEQFAQRVIWNTQRMRSITAENMQTAASELDAYWPNMPWLFGSNTYIHRALEFLEKPTGVGLYDLFQHAFEIGMGDEIYPEDFDRLLIDLKKRDLVDMKEFGDLMNLNYLRIHQEFGHRIKEPPHPAWQGPYRF